MFNKYSVSSALCFLTFQTLFSVPLFQGRIQILDAIFRKIVSGFPGVLAEILNHEFFDGTVAFVHFFGQIMKIFLCMYLYYAFCTLIVISLYLTGLLIFSLTTGNGLRPNALHLRVLLQSTYVHPELPDPD